MLRCNFQLETELSLTLYDSNRESFYSSNLAKLILKPLKLSRSEMMIIHGLLFTTPRTDLGRSLLKILLKKL